SFCKDGPAAYASLPEATSFPPQIVWSQPRQPAPRPVRPAAWAPTPSSRPRAGRPVHRAAFDAFTGTALARTHRRPSELVLRGISWGQAPGLFCAGLIREQMPLDTMDARQVEEAATRWSGSPPRASSVAIAGRSAATI